VYLRSILVVVLCSIFVVGFALTIVYEASTIGTGTSLATTQETSCTATLTCPSLSITSVRLATVNYTDELGPVDYAVLTLKLTTSGTGQIGSVTVYVGNLSAGTVQGPFEPGTSKTINMTLPSTITVTEGMSYLVNVEGRLVNGSEVVWESAKVTATATYQTNSA